MYAVIETGGKQYRVELGTELAVERLDGAPGDTIDFERVLLVADGDEASIGTPVVSDALVQASVVRQDRGEKVIVFKYRPKARHRAKKGHRQEQTVIRVADIRFNGRSASDEATAQQKEDAKARRQAAVEAERKAAADKALAAKLEEEAAAKADEASSKPAKKTRRTTKASTAAESKPAQASGDKPAPAKTRRSSATGSDDSGARPKTTRTRQTRTKKGE
jgi:large subunit ribosomal protein L21